MQTMETLFKYFPEGTPLYILLHYLHQKSLGLEPMAVSATEKDLWRAVQEAAFKMLEGRPTKPQLTVALSEKEEEMVLREARKKVTPLIFEAWQIVTSVTFKPDSKNERKRRHNRPVKSFDLIAEVA
jgi:hypothetical protein